MTDRETRRAATLAALVAVPVALVAGFVMFQVMSPDGDPDDDPDGDAGPARPVPTAPVPMSAPPLAERPYLVCRALLAKLPERFGDLPRRPVTAGAEQNAAYGDPAVTVACGATGPTPPGGAQYFAIDGVCWYVEDAAGARRWSLQGREVPVVVTVPTAHRGEDLVDLSKPLKEAVPEVADVCR